MTHYIVWILASGPKKQNKNLIFVLLDSSFTLFLALLSMTSGTDLPCHLANKHFASLWSVNMRIYWFMDFLCSIEYLCALTCWPDKRDNRRGHFYFFATYKKINTLIFKSNNHSLQLCRIYTYKFEMGSGSSTVSLCAACTLCLICMFGTQQHFEILIRWIHPARNLSAPGNQEVPLQLSESLRSVLPAWI